MDFWNRRGRPAIFAALEAACNTIEDDLAAELHDRDQRRHAFLTEEVERLRVSASKVERLEQENRSLRRDLDELREQQEQARAGSAVSAAPPSGDPGTPIPYSATAARTSLHAGGPATRQILGELCPNTVAVNPSNSEKPDWEKELLKLSKRHALLEERFEQKRIAARKVQDQRDEWRRYAEKLQAKVERLEKRLRVNGNSSSVRDRSFEAGAISPAAALGAKIPEPRAAEHVHEASPTEPEAHTSFASNPDQRTSSDADDENTDHLRHGRRAISTPAVMPTLDTIPSIEQETLDEEDEGYEVLPTMPISKSYDARVTIKDAPSSDGPVIVSERSVRKRKNTDDQEQMPPPSRKIKSEHSISSDPVIMSEANGFSPHESMDLDSRPDEMPTPRKRRLSGHQHLMAEYVEGVTNHQPPPGAGVSGGANDKLISSPPPVDGESDVWTPKQPASARNRDDDGRALATQKGRRSAIIAAWSLNAGVADVAEDGTNLLDSDKPRQARGLQNPGSSKASRLQALLNHHSLEKDPPVLLRPARDTPRLEEADENKRYAKPRISVTPASKVSHTASPSIETRTPNTTRRLEQSPLRERPVAELRIEDFKINPKFNDGYNHAYDEVVRNKSDRAELPGCTDPNCCGKKFRAMAKAELDAGGSLIPGRAADVKLLEDYLGDEAYKLGRMTREEKQELWLEAKVRDLANRYGRHRHRFARRPSPPGYWNPDFPSTQEMEKNREEGEKMEKRLVEERHREAVRGGGRWLFRDE